MGQRTKQTGRIRSKTHKKRRKATHAKKARAKSRGFHPAPKKRAKAAARRIGRKSRVMR